MKKIIRRIEMALIFLVIVAIAAIPVNSGFFPMPFSGRVEGPYVENLIIQVTNIRTGLFLTTKTTQAGEWLIDWDRDTARTGDQFSIAVKDCDTASCKAIVTFNNEPEIFTVLEIYDACVCPICVCPKCVCPACTYEDIDYKKVGITGVISLVIALMLFMGGGLKIYKKRTGAIAAHHKHRGIRGYHDFNTLHNNVKYRHARFRDDPLKFAKDIKKIEEQGGLI